MQAIVLDAAPLLKDRPLEKASTRALLSACEHEELRVIVPRVVIDEVVSAARGSYRNVLKEVRKANHILRQQIPAPAQYAEPDIERLTKEFEDHLVSTLEAHEVEIVDHADVPHEDLVRRDLDHRKPFNAGGKGYRDALIWHVLRDVDEERIVFVSTNTQDFAADDDRSRLHPELAEELDDAGRVTILADLPEVVERLGQLREDLSEAVAEALQQNNLAIANDVLGEVPLPVPRGMDSDTIFADRAAFTVQKVSYAWNLVAATVVAEIEFQYSGTLDEWGVEELDPALDVDLVEWLEDSFTAVIAGQGEIRARLSIAYDQDAGSVELLEAEPLEDE